MSEPQAKPEKKRARGPSRVLVEMWLAFGTAFVCFVVAGQMFTTRVSEMFEVMSIELPYVTAFAIEHERGLAVAFVASGLVILAASRVRVRAEWAGIRPVTNVLPILAAALGIALVYSSVLATWKMGQTLMQ